MPRYDGPDLYHYTNLAGINGILKSGVIKSTKVSLQKISCNDVTIGPGVYLTSLDPFNYTKEEILLNYYGTVKGFEDKADFYVKLSKAHIQRDFDNGQLLYKSDTYPNVYVLQDKNDQMEEKLWNRLGYHFDEN